MQHQDQLLMEWEDVSYDEFQAFLIEYKGVVEKPDEQQKQTTE